MKRHKAPNTDAEFCSHRCGGLLQSKAPGNSPPPPGVFSASAPSAHIIYRAVHSLSQINTVNRCYMQTEALLCTHTLYRRNLQCISTVCTPQVQLGAVRMDHTSRRKHARDSTHGTTRDQIYWLFFHSLKNFGGKDCPGSQREGKTKQQLKYSDVENSFASDLVLSMVSFLMIVRHLFLMNAHSSLKNAHRPPVFSTNHCFRKDSGS